MIDKIVSNEWKEAHCSICGERFAAGQSWGAMIDGRYCIHGTKVTIHRIAGENNHE